MIGVYSSINHKSRRNDRRLIIVIYKYEVEQHSYGKITQMGNIFYKKNYFYTQKNKRQYVVSENNWERNKPTNIPAPFMSI